MNKVFLACVVASLFVACSKKDILKWINKPGPKPSVPCRIDSIYPAEKGDIMYGGWVAVDIKYNDKGNPIVLNYDIDCLCPYTGKFSVYYKYDSKDRLIEVDPAYVDPVLMELESVSPVLPHKFVYEGNSQLPVRDSLLSDTFSGITDGVAYKVFTVKVEDLYYDAQGRVNRVVSRRTFRNTLNTEAEYYTYEAKFSYDPKGNRQTTYTSPGTTTPATISYTNKPSLYSLHPVWQLVHRNWSKNAAEMNVQTYNSNGLPTKVDISEEHFLHIRNRNTEVPFNIIKYTCY